MNLTSPSQVKAWCIEHEFHPNKVLGQNFLIDRNALVAIVDAGLAFPGGNPVPVLHTGKRLSSGYCCFRRIRQCAAGCEKRNDHHNSHDPCTGLLIPQGSLYSFPDSDFSKGCRAGADPVFRCAQGQKGGRIRLSVLRRLTTDGSLVAGFFDIPAKQNITDPQDRIEPVERKQQEAEQFPERIFPGDMCLLVCQYAGLILIGKS